MKSVFTTLGAIIGMAFLFPATAQSTSANAAWRKAEELNIPVVGERRIIPQKYLVYRADPAALSNLLDQAPLDASGYPGKLMTLPAPDGNMQRFLVHEYFMMQEGLRLQLPKIKTYLVQGLDDASASGVLDITEQGFHAMIISASGSWFIDPYHSKTIEFYQIYYKRDFRPGSKAFECGLHRALDNGMIQPNPKGLPSVIDQEAAGGAKTLIGTCSKKAYRLAVAATGEYTIFQGGTISLAAGAIATTINRVNGVYLREFATQLNLIANNNNLIYTNGSSDPYSNGNASAMINENQTNVTNVIGSANYDIGHVFGTNSGGLAGLGVTCSSTQKARGVTGSSAPVGDPFDIDYVAHELGHQFGANHTFNNSCGGNINSGTAMEPGSGSTIMAYAGICSPNVQSNSDDYFHTVSLLEIATNIASDISSACPVVTSVSNSAPSIGIASAASTIPKSTPFVLTASAADANNTSGLTYCWEQYNNQSSTQPPVATSTTGPNFRSLNPSLSGSRYFPKLSDLASNASTTWEVLSSAARTFNFRCAVRDNHAQGGCVDYGTATVTVDANSGPFLVTYPNTSGLSFAANSSVTITWNVANTIASPVNCSNVEIYLSTDGGLSFPTLLTTTANDGSQAVILPNSPSSTARIMVKAAGNIFFDISNSNFTITQPTGPDFAVSAGNDIVICRPASTGSVNGSIVPSGGFSGTVALTAGTMPAGITLSFSPSSVNTASGTSFTSNVSISSSVAAGTYTLPFNAVSGSISKSASISLTVYEAPASPAQSTPANAAINQSVTSTTFSWSSVSNASSYLLQISGNSAMSNVVYSVTVTGTTHTTSGFIFNPNTNYFWRVTATTPCGNTSSASVFSFTTQNNLCRNFSASGLPLSISASGTPTVSATINVNGVGTVNSVTVTNITGTHTYINDLRISLRNPANTSVSLMNNVCSSEDNFNIGFSGSATNTYAQIPCPPTSGLSYQPLQALSAFNGSQVNGNWIITVYDAYDVDGGSLSAASIQVCYTPICTASLNVSATAESCAGQCNGSVSSSFSNFVGTASYVWSNSSTANSISALCPGNYTVTASDQNGCSYTATGNIATGGTPATVSAGANLSVCANQTAFLSGSAGGSAASAVWSSSGNGSFGNANSLNTSYIPDSADIAAGQVTLVLTTNDPAGGCPAVTDTMELTVKALPSASINPGTVAICPGEQTALSATGGISYLWSSGDSTASITKAVTGSYTVTVTASNGCSASSSATITSSTNCSPIVTGPDTICAGASVNYTVSTVSGATVYTWSASPSAGVSITGTSQTTKSIKITTAGNYVISVVPNNGSLIGTKSIFVRALPSGGTISGPRPVCQNSSGTYSVSGMSNVTGYIWSAPSGSSLISSSGNTGSFQFGASPSYSISVFGTNHSCRAVTPRSLVVNTVLPPAGGVISGNSEVCQKTLAVYSLSGMTNTSSSTTYIWSVTNGAIMSGSGASRTITFPNAGFCTITVQAMNGSCAGVPISYTVTVNSTPTATYSISGASSICEGLSSNYTATASSGVNYAWSLNPGNAGSITAGQGTNAITLKFNGTYLSANNPVTVSMIPSIGNCTKTASTRTVTVNKYPGLCSLSSSRDTACSGQSVVLNASSLYAATYTWSISGSASAGTGTTSSRTISMGSTHAVVRVTPRNGACAGTLVQKTIIYNPVCAASRMDFAGSKEFRLFPNPAAEKVYLQFDGLIENGSKKFEFSILNSSGIELYKDQAELTETEEVLEIETSELPSGIYFIQINSADGVQVLRMLKQ